VVPKLVNIGVITNRIFDRINMDVRNTFII
jgi:hypothetical protein